MKRSVMCEFPTNVYKTKTKDKEGAQLDPVWHDGFCTMDEACIW